MVCQLIDTKRLVCNLSVCLSKPFQCPFIVVKSSPLNFNVHCEKRTQWMKKTQIHVINLLFRRMSFEQVDCHVSAFMQLLSSSLAFASAHGMKTTGFARACHDIKSFVTCSKRTPHWPVQAVTDQDPAITFTTTVFLTRNKFTGP